MTAPVAEGTDAAAAAAAAAERKRKRLEAWRRRQQQQKVGSVGVGGGGRGGASVSPQPPLPPPPLPPPPPPPPSTKPAIKIALGTKLIGGGGKHKRKSKKNKKKNHIVAAVSVGDKRADSALSAKAATVSAASKETQVFKDDDRAKLKRRAIIDEEEGGGDDEVARQRRRALEADMMNWNDGAQSGGDVVGAVVASVPGSGSALIDGAVAAMETTEEPPAKRIRETGDGEAKCSVLSSSEAPTRKVCVAAAITKPTYDGDEASVVDSQQQQPKRKKSKKSRRWDVSGEEVVGGKTVALNLAPHPPRGGGHGTAMAERGVDSAPRSPAGEVGSGVDDALDLFMKRLDAGAMGTVATQDLSGSGSGGAGNVQRTASLSINVAGTMMGSTSGGGADGTGEGRANFTSVDWESDANATPGGVSGGAEESEDDEIEKGMATANGKGAPPSSSSSPDRPAQLASEVKSEKQRREERIRELEKEARLARHSGEGGGGAQFGRLYGDEGGVMEESERALDVLTAAPDALEVLAELNKKKELRSVDHANVEYLDITKNLYIVPRSLAKLSNDDVVDRRAKLRVRVRGPGCPAPVSDFRECGFSERILSVLSRMKIKEPFPVQSQCLPAIMAGRDVIGIAKTGSGKTLAYLLPMLRHILAQPDLAPHESGPIGLVLAPARELATQIHSVCRSFARHLGLKSTAVYGGAGVAEQISDLKRGVHMAVATPGRMIDILTMQSGKILSLQRVSYVVMDEADRMFDMGFAPQISAILSAVRPDRQTVLFSATFPKTVEALARKSLRFPLEVMVGGRSVASDSIKQHGELVEEEDKFYRLLQLLGEYVDDDRKVIVFVDTQARADSVFEQLIRCGYPSLSLHGGKEQEDRDSTISDFKRPDGPGVLVATSVAGRGLDVPSCICVINYSAPNHLEDYVHRVGRTGRAGNKGFAHTFVNSCEEAKFAPIVVRAMSEAGQCENVSDELRELSDGFKAKVAKGEARYAGSGFKGKGYTYDATELTDAQKLARLEKRQALIEAGLMDPDDEDPLLGDLGASDEVEKGGTGGESASSATIAISESFSSASRKAENNGAAATATTATDLPIKLSADLLALPGMQEAILKKTGMLKEGDGAMLSSNGANHFVEEIEINDYPREARWKVTQKETTSRLQDEFQTAVTLKGEYQDSSRQPSSSSLEPSTAAAAMNADEGERKLYLHLEAQSEQDLKKCVHEIRRLLNEETLRVSARGIGGGGGGGGSHRYNVLG